mmetsp:Transcript_9620/g.17569  ORF Transcript_9620/g.17569 Transcript_9620/m.17569 type:complete len:282 (-) Transcript_9620:130-975(-)
MVIISLLLLISCGYKSRDYAIVEEDRFENKSEPTFISDQLADVVGDRKLSKSTNGTLTGSEGTEVSSYRGAAETGLLAVNEELAEGEFAEEQFSGPSERHTENYAENYTENFQQPQFTSQTSVREASVAEALKTADFYLLFIAQFCGTGAGLMTLNNLGQISTALGGSISLYAGCVVCGLAYGCLWCLCPCLVSELFGSKNFGTIYSLLNIAPAGGSIAFSVGLAGYVYAQHTRNGAKCCLGEDCYKLTFILCGILTAGSGLIVCGVIAVRNRHFYSAQRR